MSILLGIDTGGTYTDAVLFDDSIGKVVATAKARTTHERLDNGIGEAARAVIAAAGVAPSAIDLASVSTTLATNALVESKGGRVALVYIGFSDGELARGGLAAALGTDPIVHVAGGHNSHGEPRHDLDIDELRSAILGVVETVDAFAVVAEFSVRNPAHEIAVRDLIHAICDRSVTCSHELSAKLNGPKRAVTTVLNARLIGLVEELLSASHDVLLELGISAPVMVVRGDGSLVSADFAKHRPIETILSGPAASVVGASHLSKSKSAVICDVGGTTTDIAVVHEGRPTIDPHGATVGGHRTMVEAVAMHTHGLGGDSEVCADLRSLPGKLVLGPRRAIPLAVLAVDFGDEVGAELDRQLRLEVVPASIARFVLRSPRLMRHGLLSDDEQALLDQIGDGICAVDTIARSRNQGRALESVLRQGLVMVSTFTPTDAAHVLGLQHTWNAQASFKGAMLLARLRGADGNRLADSAEGLAQETVDRLIRRSAEVVLEAGLHHDGIGGEGSSLTGLARTSLDRRSNPSTTPIAAVVDVGMALPIVGLGASAPTYYPHVGALLGVAAEIPEHADVANAIGAVVGQVRFRREVVISQPSDGTFRSHVLTEPHDFGQLDEARDFTETELRRIIERLIEDAGADTPRVEIEWTATWVTSNNAELFVEGNMVATAVARPRF